MSAMAENCHPRGQLGPQDRLVTELLFLRKWLNAIGLIFGIVGVVFIFIWGPSQPSFERGVWIGLEDNTPLANGNTVAQNNAEIAAREAHYKCPASVGNGESVRPLR